MDIRQSTIIEGFSDDIVKLFLTSAIIFLPVAIYVIRYLSSSLQQGRLDIHPDSQNAVWAARRNLNVGGGATPSPSAPPLPSPTPTPTPSPSPSPTPTPSPTPHTHRATDDIFCPVCLNDAVFAVETNCGHLFCAPCLIAYWRHGHWLGPVNCPVCRQTVTLIISCFTQSDLSAEGITPITTDIRQYNRRFSGEPRTFAEHIRDIPTLFRHLWSELFSVSGLVWMVRLRIAVCLFAAMCYLISPLDILPEAVFGLLGLIDDVFIIFLLVSYLTISYRQVVADR